MADRSDLVPWPDDWPVRSQRACDCKECRCDMLIGPCQCGAWHKAGDFIVKGGVLYDAMAGVPDPCQRRSKPA